MRRHTFILIFFACWITKHAYGQGDQTKVMLGIGVCDTLAIYGEAPIAYSWVTGNQDIVSVNEQGVICGISAGETYVSATSKTGGKVKQFAVNVSGKEPALGSIKKPSDEQMLGIDRKKEQILHEIVRSKAYTSVDSRLKVAENGRYLVHVKDGAPFLFLSQTLWAMPRRLSRKEVIQVLDKCVEQGFTAIQMIAHAHYMGPNVYKDEPFEKTDFLLPAITRGHDPAVDEEYDWWDHVEFIIEECVKRRLFVCLLPTWREQWNQKENLNTSNALAYGRFMGKRFRHLNPWMIWVMGGDAAPDTEEKYKIHTQLAKGITLGINEEERYDNVMMTYHTYGPSITNDYFPADEPFIDFNTIQSGHGLDNLEGMIEKSYQTQHKPTLDFEPYYDKNGITIHQTRTAIYWGVFSGGFGTSYGSWNIWHCGGRNDLAPFKIPDALENGFGKQIKYLGQLLTSHPMMLRVPNQNVLADNHTKGLERLAACSATDSSYVFVYSPKGDAFTVNLNQIKGNQINWCWYNPRNGEIVSSGLFIKKGATKEFIPPSQGDIFSGHDWVLIIDGQLNKS